MATDSRVASTGFIGVNNRSKSSKVYSLSELAKMGIRVVEWDGRAVVICAGHPDDVQWDILMDLAADAIEVARNKCSVSSSNSHHRWGDFISLRCGVSYGGGQTASSNLSNSTVNKIIVEWLNSLELILWELGIAIEFPSGSSILLPSALISRSNVSIAPHERRYSFTQYTAGGLFRWVAYGGKTKAEYLASLSPEGLAQYAQEEAARWTEGLKKMPVISKG
ncbi:hypothetical protein JR316_0001682 [Psilocybe cubensis]|uniref:Uncharacterized protein n=1 Tax=Psilocybe cubensis TaxID=181762 RepID=A0ACB8H9V5_PSICU|nr:hypothetical protein JR316_0001682 [Psilocybe cubensis]KAH9484780.1 hypothetical protein JR316_0001682 [Psilocybe cubensis]